MQSHLHTDFHVSEHETSPFSSPSQVITPSKSLSRGLLADLAGWSSYSDMRIQAPGSESSGSPLPYDNLTRGTPSGTTHAAEALKSSHLPTPQSPGNMSSYLLTRTPTSGQNAQSDLELNVLPTEFHSHVSHSPSPFRPHLIPTPESSPLIIRSCNNGPYALPQTARTTIHDDNDFIQGDENGSRSRASTPPGSMSRRTSTRPVTPVSQFRPGTPLQRRSAENGLPTPSHDVPLRSNNLLASPLLQRIKDDPGGESTRIRAQLIEGPFAPSQAAEPRRPDYFKRIRRSTPTSNAGASAASFASDPSLLASSGNVGIINTPINGKRIALFQETSEESFEESLMAGGYGRYRSDGISWKHDEEADEPNQLGDAIGEDGLASTSGMVLTEEEKRKKTRLAAFLDPPRGLCTTTQLFPVEVEGCGRVLMKFEPSEPQTPPKPTPKSKRSRKRKKPSADMKPDADEGSITVLEGRSVDGPNWPDTEFPWRAHLMMQNGLSNAEREERLQYIESFLDRDSDDDSDNSDVGEGHSSLNRSIPDGTSSRSPRPGRGKMYPLLSHSKGRRRASTMLSVISSDPADAKTALLSKKSVRAVQLRLLRRRNADDNADSDDGETLCVCQGPDDGRPLVQCDACQTWYHLECIGIQSASELGREEDPWFCANCVEVKTPPPVVVPLSEPTFVPTDDGGRGISGRGDVDLDGYEPPFLNAGLNPSPAAPWASSSGPPRTPPRGQPGATQVSSRTSWEEAPSSSPYRGPHTPQFDTASAFGDMVRVYGMTPGRSLEPPSSSAIDESPFDPTSTPSRGIRFGLPFTTPKDGRWETTWWQGSRGGGHELFHTPKRPGEDISSRTGRGLQFYGRAGEISHEGPSAAGTQQGPIRTGLNNVTPVERDVSSGLGPRWTQGLESPLGAKRPRRSGGS